MTKASGGLPLGLATHGELLGPGTRNLLVLRGVGWPHAPHAPHTAFCCVLCGVLASDDVHLFSWEGSNNNNNF